MSQATMHQVQKLLTKLYRQVGTPLAAEMETCLLKGEWSELQKFTTRAPASYPSVKAYWKDALCTEIARKLLLPGDKDRRRQAAVDTFWASETQCATTNHRLIRFHPQHKYLRDALDVRVDDFISRWRKEMRRVLGKASYALQPLFSGGSTLSDKGKLTTIPDKMSSQPTVTHSAVSFYSCFRFTPQHELHPEPKVVRGNRFFTVPKDSTKDRGCCVEASVNVSLQLDVGRKLKERYRKVYGVDLKHAQDIHRELAQKASSGELDLATIDLSNASDTVSRVLIELLLPADWWELLNSLRAKFTVIDGKTVLLEKFSSMGNGFTFELETIVFRTLCETLGLKGTYVFGDDIICERSRSADVLAALEFFGFTPNQKKTFCEGPFRESCGGDFFDGQPVRAHYLKEIPDEPQKWIALANGLRRVDPNMEFVSSAWRYCLDQIPLPIRLCRGPSWLGDVVIHDPSSEPVFRTYTTKTNGVRHINSPTYFYRVYRPVGRGYNLGQHWSYRVATAAASLGVPSEVIPRDSISGYKLDWVAAYGVSGTWDWCGTEATTREGRSKVFP